MDKKVIWVDDDTELKPFQEALRNKGFDLCIISSIDEAVKMIGRAGAQGPALLIWDVSVLPHGRDFAHRVDEGDAFGGVPFFHWFREVFARTPTLLFTSFRAITPDWSRPDRREFAACKAEYLPDEFASFVQDLLH